MRCMFYFVTLILALIMLIVAGCKVYPTVDASGTFRMGATNPSVPGYSSESSASRTEKQPQSSAALSQQPDVEQSDFRLSSNPWQRLFLALRSQSVGV